VDPKQSYVKIIQNIGRICRKQIIKRNGTVLIPARVDVEKYKSCGGDPVARDKVIREEMSKTGDFNGILNCLSALRQEDPYMFELCLKYPDVYTKKELRDNFRKNGLTLDETEYSCPELFENMGVEYNPKVSEKANFNMLSRKLGTNIQVSNQKILEEDLYIDRESDKTTHFVKTDEDKYMKVTRDKKYKEKPEKRVERPHRNAKPFVHSNPEIQVLWGFTSDLDVGKSVFGGYIEADVVVDNEDKWYEKLEASKNYMDVHDKRPNKRDKDSSIKKMGRWIGLQLSNYNSCKQIMSNPEIRRAWKSFITNPKYAKYFISNDERWYKNLELTKKYIDTNYKRPSNTDKDMKIKTLGKWLGTQITNYKARKEIMKKIEISTVWKEFITDPQYSKYFTSNNDKWYEYLETTKMYIINNNKCPIRTDTDKTIKFLGRWIDIQKANYKDSKHLMTNPEIRQAWESFITNPKYSKYFISIDEQWYTNLELTKAYIEANDKRPSNGDKDKSIKTMGYWISNQLTNYKDSKYIMENPEIRQAWKDFITNPRYAKFFISNDDGWYNKLETVKCYIDMNKSRPKNNDKDHDIKILASWIRTQLTNYKDSKYIMTNPEIRQAWEDFTSDPKYSKYFTQEQKPAPKSTTIKPKIKTIDELKETEVQKLQRQQSEYQELTKKMATQKSETTNQMFTTTPSLWHSYHDSRDFSFKGYDKQDEIPLNKIIKKLETKHKHKLNILDLGCGRNLIQEHFKDNKKFTVTGYDYVSYNGSKVADISQLPEEDESINICVYSQSLMGSNWKDYLAEGYRVLVYNGEMIISESIERYDQVKDHLEAIGMRIIDPEYSETNRWFYMYAIKQ
jgi:molybdopterin biosynthesis enzyme MoaB